MSQNRTNTLLTLAILSGEHRVPREARFHRVHGVQQSWLVSSIIAKRWGGSQSL